MDYDWKYYMDDVRAGKSRINVTGEDREAAGHIKDRLCPEQRARRRKHIRDMLFEYRHNGKEENALLDDVVRQHTEYCRELSADELLKRRHNAIVYRYMIKTALHNKAAAGRLQISKETLVKDIGRAVDEFMVIFYGVPALPDTPASWTEYVKTFLENMRLLPYCCKINQRFRQTEQERERAECVETTAEVIQCMGKALQMYEEYCESCIQSQEAAQRSLEIIRALYIDSGSRSIEEIAAEQGISWETVYSDVNKATERLAELFEYMAEGTSCARPAAFECRTVKAP